MRGAGDSSHAAPRTSTSPCAKLHRIGRGGHPVAVIDGLIEGIESVIDLAASLAPFPGAANNYPGLRRVIAPNETADSYVRTLMNAAAPFIAGAFGRDSFRVLEASFSMVTRAPSLLDHQQRAPHFDSTDPNLLAVLHYLNVPDGGGTGFFRHKSTGVEQVTDANAGGFVAAATADARRQSPDAGYVGADDPHYELLLAIDARPGRTLIYQGSLLHSGLIPPTASLSPDPRTGRLTGNFFVQLEADRS